ncbi:MAG TPA: PaaX family transcriptional regulator C-terminal domain-containing protein [Pseudonocardia sp.]|nr:PaaX family transcriptional regulator C-terminal domain-containing protein [Pseudonocardia sp.]
MSSAADAVGDGPQPRRGSPLSPATNPVMNHRSLVFDLFGGYVRYDGGGIALRDLAAVAEPFGVSADALRVVMSRLRREGWFDVSRSGGRARYEATDRTWALLDEGYERIFVAREEPWSGEWHVVIYEVSESERAAREQLRRELAWLGFGPLAASTWLSPHDRLDAVLEWAADQPSVRIVTLIARSRGVAHDREYAARCWDLAAIQRDYLSFLRQYGSAEATAAWRAATGTDALVRRVRLAHDYRLFLFRDPRLPAHLLPPDWPAQRARDLFTEAYGHLEAEAVSAYRRLTGTVRVETST